MLSCQSCLVNSKNSKNIPKIIQSAMKILLETIKLSKGEPRRGALNGWIMISFCQDMACLAVYSSFKTLN